MDIKTRFDSIVEKKIREAMEEGKFDNLPGKGKPLSMEDNSHVDEELRMAYKVLKNAGCVPKELEHHVEIKRLEDILAHTDDVSFKLKAMKKLEVLKMKAADNGVGKKIFNIHEDYADRIINLLDKNKNK